MDIEKLIKKKKKNFFRKLANTLSYAIVIYDEETALLKISLKTPFARNLSVLIEKAVSEGIVKIKEKQARTYWLLKIMY